MVKVPKYSLIRHHKRCWFILTAGRWSWKSKSAKKCVTTYLPNGSVPKMDGAQVFVMIDDRYFSFIMKRWESRVK